MTTNAELIEFKRKQIASLHDNGSDAAKAAIARLSAEVAALEGNAPPSAAPAATGDTPSEVMARLAELADRVEQLAARLAVVEVLSAPAPTTGA